MTEEQNNQDVDVEETPVPIVEEQPVEQGVDTRVASEGSQPSDQEINWQKANETMKGQGDQIKFLESQLQKLQGENISRQQKQEIKSIFGDRDKEDLLTVGEMEQVLLNQKKEFALSQAEVVSRSRYPDMDEVINKYGKSLPDSVKEAVMRAPNPHLAAYEAIKNSGAYYKDTLSSAKHENATRAEKNLSKPGSVSSVGSSGALSKASYYENMSESDLLEISDRYIRGG